MSRARAVQVEVQPLSLSGSSRLGQSSSSTRPTADTSFASTALWHTLRRTLVPDDEDDNLFVAVQWSEERRIRGKGKSRNLIVQVQLVPDDIQSDVGDRVLHVPLQLLPRFSDIPIHANLYVHRPVTLSTVILQPILDISTSDDSAVGSAGLDLSNFIGNAGHFLPNGTVNGHHNEPRALPKIWREGHNILIQHRQYGRQLPFRIAMLEPASQGYIISDTCVIISTEQYDPDGGEEDDHVNGVLDEASSQGRTHVSLANFDPDSFLSSTLDSAFWAASTSGIDAEGDTAQSVSSTSGSITPRPPGTHLPIPPSPPAPVEGLNGFDEHEDHGMRFSAVQSLGPGSKVTGKDVCWVSVAGLGRAGIFEGDWVLLRSVGGSSTGGRLAKILAWEHLDQEDNDDLPSDPILIPPTMFRSLFISASSAGPTEIRVQATPFGARPPMMPIARNITVCRIATTEGVDKRYERSWLQGLRRVFDQLGDQNQGQTGDQHSRQVVRRGDTFAVPVWQDTPIPSGDGEVSSSEDEEDDYDRSSSTTKATGLVYFKVTAMNYEPLVPVEDDFRSSISSKARAGELGCWIDIGHQGETQLVLDGLERDRVGDRGGEKAWHNITRYPAPYDRAAESRLRDLLQSCVIRPAFASASRLSILIEGARGSGKKALLRYIADCVGFSIITVDCYDVVGESHAVTEGILTAQLEKVFAASPSILLLDHIDALAKRSESSATRKSPAIVKVLEDLMSRAHEAAAKDGWPILLVGTVVDRDSVPGELTALFKQDMKLSAPDESQRLSIVKQAFDQLDLAPDVRLQAIATQTAALQAGDIQALARRAFDNALLRAQQSSKCPEVEAIQQAGLSVTSTDISAAVNDARASYSDSIGAPKIPNVSWDDIGGLQAVKDDILDTIQLPLQHPELFAEGLKKRSGILLYGPPGTGKTLLAKAVATSCSLNFFSVKGPELLNMYIGESEANVRRVFQRARDASPCVIFMDELDSVAPKRGNQGDSGGVMDRIVSQLLAELDGMSSGGGNAQVYVLGATNRPDLLDPALLRPGRFDRMLYLSVPTSHPEQLSILQALTRKFKLDPSLDLVEISVMCPFNYTGADFYALCSDAMLKAMTRAADRVDRIVERLNADPESHSFPRPLTVQYYLATMADQADIDVKVGREDFVQALKAMKPSVSESEMRHYERVQQEFKGYSIGENR